MSDQPMREMRSDELVEAMENLHQYPRLIAERAYAEGLAAATPAPLDVPPPLPPANPSLMGTDYELAGDLSSAWFALRAALAQPAAPAEGSPDYGVMGVLPATPAPRMSKGEADARIDLMKMTKQRDDLLEVLAATPAPLDVLYGFPKSYTEPEAAAWIAGARATLAATPAPLDGEEKP